MAVDPNAGIDPALIEQQQQLQQQVKAIQDYITYAQQQYGNNHFGGMSGDQFAAFLATQQGKLAPLQQQLDQTTLQVAQQKQTNQYSAQQAAQLQEQKDLQTQMLGQLPGMEQQMGQNLAGQTQYAFNQIQPQIEQRLNALGILQSGALPEAQAKAFGDLQNAAQAQIGNFDMNARNMIQLQYPMQYTGQDIGLQQQSLQNALNLQDQGIQRQFGQQDVQNQMLLQQQLSLQALAQAQQQQQAQQQAAWISGGASLLGSAVQAGAGMYNAGQAPKPQTQVPSYGYGDNTGGGYAGSNFNPNYGYTPIY